MGRGTGGDVEPTSGLLPKQLSQCTPQAGKSSRTGVRRARESNRSTADAAINRWRREAGRRAGGSPGMYSVLLSVPPSVPSLLVYKNPDGNAPVLGLRRRRYVTVASGERVRQSGTFGARRPCKGSRAKHKPPAIAIIYSSTVHSSQETAPLTPHTSSSRDFWRLLLELQRQETFRASSSSLISEKDFGTQRPITTGGR